MPAPKVVVVTGASAGVGRATAVAFARKGARVGLLARGRAGLEGAAREVREAGGQALVIPVDVADADADAVEAYPFEASWQVIQPLEVAVLGAALTARLAHFPSIVSELVGRALARSRRGTGSLVTAQLTSVDHRLLVSMWHLADRWGRVRHDGILLPLPLTHEALGLLVAARRPSVTAALGRLTQRNVIVAQSEGGWLLCGQAPDELGPRPRRSVRHPRVTITADRPASPMLPPRLRPPLPAPRPSAGA